MSFDRITDVSLWALGVIVVVVPVWLVIFPPRRVRSWPVFSQFLLAVIGSQAAVYGIFFCFIYPAVDAYARAHPHSLLDGIELFPPYVFCVAAAAVSLLLFSIRHCFPRLRRARSDDTPPSANPSA